MILQGSYLVAPFLRLFPTSGLEPIPLQFFEEQSCFLFLITTSRRVCFNPEISERIHKQVNGGRFTPPLFSHFRHPLLACVFIHPPLSLILHSSVGIEQLRWKRLKKWVCECVCACVCLCVGGGVRKCGSVLQNCRKRRTAEMGEPSCTNGVLQKWGLQKRVMSGFNYPQFLLFHCLKK